MLNGCAGVAITIDTEARYQRDGGSIGFGEHMFGACGDCEDRHTRRAQWTEPDLKQEQEGRDASME